MVNTTSALTVIQKLDNHKVQGKTLRVSVAQSKEEADRRRAKARVSLHCTSFLIFVALNHFATNFCTV